jgi:hypothetical protein
MTSNSACTDIDFINEFIKVDDNNYGLDDNNKEIDDIAPVKVTKQSIWSSLKI